MSTPQNYEEAMTRALDWAEGKLSHLNTVHAETHERMLEVVAVLDTQEVIKWVAIAEGFTYAPTVITQLEKI